MHIRLLMLALTLKALWCSLYAFSFKAPQRLPQTDKMSFSISVQRGIPSCREA